MTVSARKTGKMVVSGFVGSRGLWGSGRCSYRQGILLVRSACCQRVTIVVAVEGQRSGRK